MYFPHERNSFQDSLASLLITQKKRKIKKPWKELKMVKRIEPVSLSPGIEKVRMAKNQVSPNRNITLLILIIRRTMVFRLLTGSVFRATVLLVCRISTTLIQMNMLLFKTVTMRIGTRKAPQKAPT